MLICSSEESGICVTNVSSDIQIYIRRQSYLRTLLFSCWSSQAKKVNSVQTLDDGSCFMQPNTEVMSLHANKQIMLNNIIFDKRNLRRAKIFDHPHASIKITTYGTTKFVMVSALGNTSVQ